MSAEPTVVIILQYMEIKSSCSMYALNLCSAICQLFLNKTGGKKELGSREWHWVFQEDWLCCGLLCLAEKMKGTSAVHSSFPATQGSLFSGTVQPLGAASF